MNCIICKCEIKIDLKKDEDQQYLTIREGDNGQVVARLCWDCYDKIYDGAELVKIERYS